MPNTAKETLTQLFNAGVSAVKGDAAIRAWVSKSASSRPTRIFAAGKAAVSMFQGLPTDWQMHTPTLLVTKTDHIGDAQWSGSVEALEASHPVPDQSSMHAGQRAMDFVDQCGPDDHLLMLVSGGASALVEHLRQGVRYADLVALTETALAQGADIAEINRRRKEVSAIKGGQLLSFFKGAKVTVLAISDVEGDNIDVIASGIGARLPHQNLDYDMQIIASNNVARMAVAETAAKLGLPLIENTETLYAPVDEVARSLADIIKDGPDGLYVFGGEPTVVLPQNPGKGGRNQALALEISRCIQGRHDICGLVAGTDGTDGPTRAAGAFADGESFTKKPGAADALRRADAGTYLENTGDLFVTGPTGTNVMDLALFLKQS